jgi:putative endonuclease
VPINKDDEARLATLCTFDRDASLRELVVAHTAACLRDLPAHVHVKSVHATTHAHASVVRSVQIKLTNGGVICIDVGQVYTTRSVTMLSGYEPKPEPVWHVYVVRCADETLYCGNTTDVARRVHEHNTSARGAKYTRSRRPVTLLRSWAVGTRSDATKAELRFKRLSTKDKEKAVQ